MVLERADPAAGKGKATRCKKKESKQHDGSICGEVDAYDRVVLLFLLLLLVIFDQIHVLLGACLSLPQTN